MSEDEQFNSNCITPGTEFMDKLQKQLEFFQVSRGDIKENISNSISSNCFIFWCLDVLLGKSTVTEDEIERKSHSLLDEYFMNEKMEVNINARFLWRSCTNLDCFPFLGCCFGHEGVVAPIDRSQIYQPVLAVRTRT